MKNYLSADDRYFEDLEHDDLMDADDYERRQYEKDGWNESKYDRQRY